MSTLALIPLHPTFVAEARGVDLRQAQDEATLTALHEAMDRYGVLVFREQPLTDAQQLAFAQAWDGKLHTKTGISALTQSRLGNEALTDISNVDENGDPLDSSDRRRIYGLANQLWHTDASFENPPGRYSLLSARVIPPVPADTEFADTRAAWDALSPAEQARLLPLTAHHSIAHSRDILGFSFSAEERERLHGNPQPLVRYSKVTGRRALYLAAHASHLLEMPVAEGRLLLRDLMTHATAPPFVYRHVWQDRDLVIWDNRTTMHRARPFDDKQHRRELRRVTTLDIERT
jgi:alpha-ketoglutarate-dependent 2,4-dichlorophenoxyacetate dioxygenase